MTNNYNWSVALTPIDTKTWAESLADKNGLNTVVLRDLDLNRKGEMISSSELGNYKMDIPKAQAFKWNDGDNATNYWRPQGISGIRLNDPRLSMVAVSWYNYEKKPADIDKGCRISFVNVTPDDPKRFHYRHVLLVEKDGDSFKPVEIHAGGIGYSKGFLYLPDTRKGIRVFDLSLILGGLKEDTSKSKCGFEGNESFAFNYRYILPQVYYYDKLYRGLVDSGMAAESGNSPRFSYLSMDWSESSKRLLTGSYMDSDDFNSGKKTSMFLWQISVNEPGKLDVTQAPRNLNVPTNLKRFRWVQGAARHNSKLYISRSAGEGVKLHAFSGSWAGNNYSVHSSQTDIAPKSDKSILGFEDLHVSLYSDILCGLSEGNRYENYVGDRIVFWIKDVK